MSHITVLPNSYYNPFQAFPSINNTFFPTQATSNLINCLKSALTISLNNYQLNYSQNASQPHTSQLQQEKKNLTHLTPKNSLELIQSAPENKEILKAASRIPQPLPVLVIEDKESKKEPQTLTDDEFLLEDREKGLKKNQVNRRKGKKVKQDPLNEFIVPIPKTDLLETAYLPAFSLAFSDICKKREEILKRQVGNWSESGKCKKDKREIRMLCN